MGCNFAGMLPCLVGHCFGLSGLERCRLLFLTNREWVNARGLGEFSCALVKPQLFFFVVCSIIILWTAVQSSRSQKICFVSSCIFLFVCLFFGLARRKVNDSTVCFLRQCCFCLLVYVTFSITEAPSGRDIKHITQTCKMTKYSEMPHLPLFNPQ